MTTSWSCACCRVELLEADGYSLLVADDALDAVRPCSEHEGELDLLITDIWSVHRIWRDHKLKPQQLRTFKFSNDPRLVEKVIDVVGLYLAPPEGARDLPEHARDRLAIEVQCPCHCGVCTGIFMRLLDGFRIEVAASRDARL